MLFSASDDWNIVASCVIYHLRAS